MKSLVLNNGVISEVDTGSEPTGFVSRETSILSFSDDTRTFTIIPNPEFQVFLKGILHKFSTPQSTIITNVNGNHFLYFDYQDGRLKSRVDFVEDIITKHAFVSVVYWRADLQKHIYFAEERHGITMDGETHLHLHESLGSQYVSGLSLLNIISDSDGSLDTNSQFGIQVGIIRDEDIKIAIQDELPQNLSPIGQFPVLYRTGNNLWNKTTPDLFPLILNGDNGYVGTLPAHNYFDGTNWVLGQTSNNNYILVHVLATNDIENPVICILGNQYTTKSLAKENAQVEFSTYIGLPFTEFVLVATVIFLVKDVFTNTSKAVISKTIDGYDYVDWRKKNPFALSTNASSNSFQNVFIQEGSSPSEPVNAPLDYYFVYTVNNDLVTPYIWDANV